MGLRLKKFYFLCLLSGFTVSVFAANPAPGDSTLLPEIILSGKKGGLANGADWSSASLTGKVNLLFYVDPDKQKQLQPLIAKLDSLHYPADRLGTTLILNTSATIIPGFVFRKKVAKRAKSDKNKSYVFDNKRILVRDWKLIDDDINIVLFHKSGHVFYKHAGRVSNEVINTIIQKIEHLLTKES